MPESWDHENSLKDGKVNTPKKRKSRRCEILATTKGGGNLIFQESYARESVHVMDIKCPRIA
jgi:hypothetical protein